MFLSRLRPGDTNAPYESSGLCFHSIGDMHDITQNRAFNKSLVLPGVGAFRALVVMPLFPRERKKPQETPTQNQDDGVAAHQRAECKDRFLLAREEDIKEAA